ncbi:hypothetical protein GW17_00053419 [Ensete ventricosum]|nr:hypothetical protein GW17_00053419 [Ensete ventricosum]
MGHHSCCNQQKVRRGLWSPEEDEKLIRYITAHGYCCWSEVPMKAGPASTLSLSLSLSKVCLCLSFEILMLGSLYRASKVWQELPLKMDQLLETRHKARKDNAGGGEVNHQPPRDCWEQVLICPLSEIIISIKLLECLHCHIFYHEYDYISGLISSSRWQIYRRWAHIASHLPGRTDNEIKNYWNSWIKKKIRKPTTPQPPPSPRVELGHPSLDSMNQLDSTDLHQDLTSKSSLDPIFPSPWPLFMFDDGGVSGRHSASSCTREEPLQEATCSDLYNVPDHKQDEAEMPSLFDLVNSSMTYNNLPPLVDDVENTVTEEEAQPCCLGDNGEVCGESFEKKGLGEWLVPQQYSCLLSWDDVRSPIGDEAIITASSSMAAMDTTFPLPWQ